MMRRTAVVQPFDYGR